MNLPNKKLNFGNIDITNAVLLAPLEGITDLPFRLICKEFGADIVYTEFIASEALIRNIPQSFRKIVLSDKEHPVAVQIFGSDPNNMAEAAKIAQEEGADFVDINYGCWVKKIVNNNAGSALMKNPQLMAEISRKCVDSVFIPVTCKTRLGWDYDSINIYEIAEMQQQAGIQAITVHCRTRSQKITGNADWSFIPKIKQHLFQKNISIPIILNGDILSPELALDAMNIEGADAIMLARGAIGNPFIFRQVKQLLRGKTPTPITIEERIATCLKHLSLNIEYNLRYENAGLIEFRKHYSGYLKGLPNSSLIRQKLVRTTDFSEINDILNRFKDNLL